MKKQLIRSLIAASIIAMNCTVFAQAARPAYLYTLTNIGRTFSENNYGTTNNKTYAGQNWSFKVSSIYFSGGVAGSGIAFRLVNNGTGALSEVRWATSTGARQGLWPKGGGPVGNYRMQGRMDDSLNGRSESAGYWNADIITTWPS